MSSTWMSLDVERNSSLVLFGSIQEGIVPPAVRVGSFSRFSRSLGSMRNLVDQSRSLNCVYVAPVSKRNHVSWLIIPSSSICTKAWTSGPVYLFTMPLIFNQCQRRKLGG